MIANLDYKIEVFIPVDFVESLQEALTAAGAGRIGNYDTCFSVSRVQGSWRPLEGAGPYAGRIGEISRIEEAKLEVSVAVDVVQAALEAIHRVHPYEEPVVNIIPLENRKFDGNA